MLRPFHPRRARTVNEARAVGRTWAEHEADDPGSLKGKPQDGSFFYVFEEAAAYVDAPHMATRRALVEALGAAACERWAELAEADPFTWTKSRR
jgi:hypothetical protein